MYATIIIIKYRIFPRICPFVFPTSLAWTSLDLLLQTSCTYSRVLYKQNHTVSTLLDLTFFTQHKVFDTYPFLVWQKFLAFYFWGIVYCVDLPQFVSSSSHWDILLVLHFGCLKKKKNAMSTCVPVFLWRCFYFSWANT